LEIARNERRILITNDRDFGELIVRLGLPHRGVVFFRLTTQDPQAKVTRLSDVLARYSTQLDRFIVVTDRRIRIRL
jgi:predicted nuclease of predicted toxin-antitoxin system